MIYFVLLSIFLVAQWSSPHAHLTEAHEHSGDRRHHSAEIHAHQPIAQHPDAIDSRGLGYIDAVGGWVVELDHSQLPSGGTQLNLRPIALWADCRILTLMAPHGFKLTEVANLLPDLLPAHIGQPRAPPQFA